MSLGEGKCIHRRPVQPKEIITWRTRRWRGGGGKTCVRAPCRALTHSDSFRTRLRRWRWMALGSAHSHPEKGRWPDGRPPLLRLVDPNVRTCGYLPYAREPEGAVEAACPQLWGRMDGAPKPSVWTEKLLLFIFSLTFYRWEGQRVKNKWPKIDEKIRFEGTLGFFPSWTYDTGKCQLSPGPPPQPENCSRATVVKAGEAWNRRPQGQDTVTCSQTSETKASHAET